MRKVLLITLLCSFWGFAQVYQDSTASVNDRVEDLLSRMTLDEKIGQMTQADLSVLGDPSDVASSFIGSVLSGGNSDPEAGNSAENWADAYDALQTQALTTRLGIPIIYGVDAMHGHSNVVGATIFPHNIGLGATRNPELVKEVNRISALEIAATGIDWTFAPCVAVPRNERWGRTYEGFGETPELAAMFGGTAVAGLQGDSLNDPLSVVACAKHYIGDGGTTNGDDQGNTQCTEEELRAIHLPGYLTALENDVKTIMTSYSSWNGEKVHGNHYLITTLLKEELGFEGFVVSDWAAIDQLPGDYASDVKTSINAGLDMIMVPHDFEGFISTLRTLINNGDVPLSRIDDAVRRILRVKFELGLFEHPMTDRSLLPLVGAEEHREVARQAARESVVMLKKNDNVLPLPKTGAKILVAGQHADDIGLQCGGWTIMWQGQAGEITKGTTILEGLQEVAPGNNYVFNKDGVFSDTDADYIIAVVGEHPYAEGDGDKLDLSVDKAHDKMLRKLREYGIPVITVLISGRPMITNATMHNSDVFMAAWLPGTEADGIADLFFGDYLPTGKLPMTWHKSNETIPMNFGDDNYDPLFPYGFGLTSYDNTATGSAPVFQSAMLTQSGNKIEMDFNKSMNNSASTTAQFTVVINGTDSINVTDFSFSTNSENRLVFELGATYSKEDVLTVSYKSGNIVSADGGELTYFYNAPVINYLTIASSFQIVPGKIEAEDYTDMFGVQTESTSDYGGGLNVGYIDDGDWLEYNCDIGVTGTYDARFRIASENGGGVLKFLVDGNEQFTVGIASTGAWQNWKSVGQFAELVKGNSTIRLEAVSGGFNLNWLSFDVFTEVEEIEGEVSEFGLAQNYPNPFNPSTQISYSLLNPGVTSLKVYNMLGEEVSELVNQFQQRGNFTVDFNAENLSSGVYFYVLKSNNQVETKKMMLLK